MTITVPPIPRRRPDGAERAIEASDQVLASIDAVLRQPFRHKDPVERHPDEDLYDRLGWDR